MLFFLFPNQLRVIVAQSRLNVKRILAEYEDVTVEQVLASPERFDDKKVRVEGFLVIEFEDQNLYTDESVYKDHTSSCLGLALADDVKSEEKKFNKRHVVLEGLFDADHCGPDYICLWSCSDPVLWVEEVHLK